LALAGGGGLHGGAPGGKEHLQRRAVGAGLGLGQLGAGQCVAGGAFGVDRVGLGPGPPRGALGPIELDDHFVGVGEVPGQPGAVATGALHRPGAQAGVLLSQGEEFGVAVGVGGDRRAGQHGTGAGIDQRGGVCLTVGVDADDDLDQLCQHGHAFFS
jgi:hypothetical protein